MQNVDFSRLWGNDAVCAMLSAKLKSDSAAHAYLITGPAGSGKKTLAFLIAAAMSCEDERSVPCFHCPACRKILSGNSPDLSMLGVEALPFAQADAQPMIDLPKSIGVDAVRALSRDVYIKPNDLDKKIYIIGHAERMTVQAQNALLKILEEPPSSVLFLLLCENSAALLTTIRSRVQSLATEVFDAGTLYRLMTANDHAAKALAAKDDTQLKRFIRLSGGCIGGVRRYMQADAKTLAADPVYEAFESASRCLSVVFASETIGTSPVLSGGGASPLPRKTALYDIITSRATTREQLRALLDALLTALRDILLCSYTDEDAETVEPLFYADAQQPRALAGTVSPASLAKGIAALTALRASLDSNPNIALVCARLTEHLMQIRFE